MSQLAPTQTVASIPDSRTAFEAMKLCLTNRGRPTIDGESSDRWSVRQGMRGQIIRVYYWSGKAEDFHFDQNGALVGSLTITA